MPNATKISVSLPPELAAGVTVAVETGEYATASEMIRDALRAWKQGRDEARIDDLAGLDSDRIIALWDEGLASPSGPLDMEEIRASARLRLKAARQARLAEAAVSGT